VKMFDAGKTSMIGLPYDELEINMHHLRGNAKPAGPLSDFLERFLPN